MRGNAEEGFAGEAELDFAVDFDFDDGGSIGRGADDYSLHDAVGFGGLANEEIEFLSLVKRVGSCLSLQWKVGF